jgi:hypothetical protein
MTELELITRRINELAEAAKDADGYAYACGYLRATLIDTAIMYIPENKRKDFIEEVERSLEYIKALKK